MLAVASFPKMLASNLDFFAFVLHFMLDQRTNPVPEPEPEPECVTVPVATLLRQKRSGSVSSSGSGSTTLSKNLLRIPEPKASATFQDTWNVTGKGRAVEVSLVWKYFGGPRSCFSSVISCRIGEKRINIKDVRERERPIG
jgi:hypothetical protein